ncbi:hypothetical protein EIP91_009846 [Steccherinum ochraceum]|uniref:Protein kinase domain-containing protein n=1 Tax=Steccherinum ochraceum TaxID=92696 RepID=A0A4R0RDN6_9APHY|nr:hypothetical protein EIP91_009846 [Steccherinum ochraceum]
MAQRATSGYDFTLYEPWPDPVVPDRYWMDHYDYLLARGFALRDNWRPSSSTMLPSKGFDASLRPLTPLPDGIDAIEVRNGRLVLIRKLQTSSLELQLLVALSSPDLREHPENHCCRIISRFSDPSEPDTTFIVIPYPHHTIFQPTFYNMTEAMDCGRQMLEGIAFFHSRGVAHVFPLPDEIRHNIPFKFDHIVMYPDSYNPVDPKYLPNGHGRCRHLRRRPDDNFYFFGHLRFAALQSTSDSCHPDCDFVVVSGTSDISTAHSTTEFNQVSLSLSDDAGEPAEPDSTSTSNLLPLHENDRDSPPTPAMIEDLRRFAFTYIRYFWKKARTI